MRKTSLRPEALLLTMVIVGWPSVSFAGGDPAIFLYAAAIFVLDIFLLAYLLRANLFSGRRAASSLIFSGSLLLTWYWALNIGGLPPAMVYGFWVGAPLLVIGGLIGGAKISSRKSGQSASD